jgi:hypothetical protein
VTSIDASAAAPGRSAARSWIRRWAQLLVAFEIYGLAVALMMRSGLGLGPWDAFHLGVHLRIGVTVGQASILAGLVIVLGSLVVGARPGPGTIANMFLIGVCVDLTLPHVPVAPGVAWGLGYYAVALGAAGLATGMYIAPRLGSGPRDGLMLALSVRFGWPVRRVRFAIELVVLLAGWLMGGTVGVGTLLFAVGIGPIVQWGLQLFEVLPRAEA